jgi:hypothetical protein
MASLLVELTGACGVLARNDPKVRQIEGLDLVFDRLEQIAQALASAS